MSIKFYGLIACIFICAELAYTESIIDFDEVVGIDVTLIAIILSLEIKIYQLKRRMRTKRNR